MDGMQHSTSTDSLVIAARFRGPPASGNGGYVAGSLAACLDPNAAQAVEVTLRAPAPLDTALRVERQNDRVLLTYGEVLVAEAVLAELDMSVPAAVSWEDARGAGKAALRSFHPICFCCGEGLPAESGLGVQCGSIEDGQRVAGAWVCDPIHAGEDGVVPAAIVWTALDCPGHMAWHAGGARGGALLGRMTARVVAPLRAGEPCMIVGWRLGSQGRKLESGTALYDRDGQLCAYAKATWIARTPPAMNL
jgi:hypothetical protein